MCVCAFFSKSQRWALRRICLVFMTVSIDLVHVLESLTIKQPSLDYFLLTFLFPQVEANRWRTGLSKLLNNKIIITDCTISFCFPGQRQAGDLLAERGGGSTSRQPAQPRAVVTSTLWSYATNCDLSCGTAAVLDPAYVTSAVAEFWLRHVLMTAPCLQLFSKVSQWQNSAYGICCSLNSVLVP